MTTETILSFTPQYQFDGPVPPIPPAPLSCAEMGRVTRAYVSGFQRNRVHEANIFPQELRCLTADFNGALAAARIITSATWSMLSPASVFMVQAEVVGRETSCVIKAQFPGRTVVRCVATLDNGETYPQMFRVNVECAPWFQNDGNWQTGPYSLVATP